MRQFSSDSVDVLSRIFPVLQMTRAFTKLLNPQQRLQVFWPLLRLNFLMSMVIAIIFMVIFGIFVFIRKTYRKTLKAK